MLHGAAPYRRGFVDALVGDHAAHRAARSHRCGVLLVVGIGIPWADVRLDTVHDDSKSGGDSLEPGFYESGRCSSHCFPHPWSADLFQSHDVGVSGNVCEVYTFLRGG